MTDEFDLRSCFNTDWCLLHQTVLCRTLTHLAVEKTLNLSSGKIWLGLLSPRVNRRSIVTDARKVFKANRVCCNQANPMKVFVMSTVIGGLMVS